MPKTNKTKQENVTYTQKNIVNKNQPQEGLDIAIDFKLAIIHSRTKQKYFQKEFRNKEPQRIGNYVKNQIM